MSILTPPDPIYALLAMDSYNHGYEEGVTGLGGVNSWIGSAKIIKQSEIGDADAERVAGFYAVAYEVNGKTVISIRGTDNKSTDIPNGYGVGFGEPDGIQAEMAIKFYKSVVADSLIASDTPRTAGILTAQ